MIKEIMFSIWGALWVAMDAVKKALEETTAKDFLKYGAKVFLYSITAIGWVAMFAAIYFVGWAAL